MIAGLTRPILVFGSLVALTGCGSDPAPTSGPTDPARLTEFTSDTLAPVLDTCDLDDRGFATFGITVNGEGNLVLNSLPYPDPVTQNRLQAIEDRDATCVLAQLGAPQSVSAAIVQTRSSKQSKDVSWGSFTASLSVDDIDPDVVTTVITVE